VISILLPSVRPEKLPAAMACIPAAVGSVSYEVVVVADFGPEEYPHTRWIVRPRKGVIDAVHAAYEASEGEYVFLFNDESQLEPGSLQLLYLAAVTDPWRVLTPYHHPPFNFQYYGLLFAAFPFVRRDLVDELGGFLDPSFKAFYADPDFSMRAHAKRIPVEVLHSAMIRHTNRHDDSHQRNLDAYLANDRALFRARWDHLGTFCDP
jgi:glycosyltransferase involved in cell wall biosynthesis